MLLECCVCEFIIIPKAYLMLQLGNPCDFIALFIHLGQVHDPRICQLYFVGPFNKVRIFIYYLYIQAELGNLGRVILLTLCTRIFIVHHKNILWKPLFILVFSLEIVFITTL